MKYECGKVNKHFTMHCFRRVCPESVRINAIFQGVEYFFNSVLIFNTETATALATGRVDL